MSMLPENKFQWEAARPLHNKSICLFSRNGYRYFDQTQNVNENNSILHKYAEEKNQNRTMSFPERTRITQPQVKFQTNSLPPNAFIWHQTNARLAATFTADIPPCALWCFHKLRLFARFICMSRHWQVLDVGREAKWFLVLYGVPILFPIPLSAGKPKTISDINISRHAGGCGGGEMYIAWNLWYSRRPNISAAQQNKYSFMSAGLPRIFSSKK